MKICNVLVLVLFLFSGIPCLGWAATSCITGGPHDLTSLGGSDNNGNACEFCHIPHNAVPGEALFNREVSKASFSPYKWVAPPNADIKIDDPLIGASRLCMSCHDGVTAIAMIDGNPVYMPERSVIGNKVVDLTRNHPIGFSYDLAMTTRKSGELVDKQERFATSITISQNSGVYNTVERNGHYKIADTLYLGEYVTCDTCHNVHGCGDDDSGYLLRAKEAASLICLSCHLK
ncbi:MAG TPA: hypothetical protein VJ550_03590 [Geomonas sp.]|nr:hypothetical protein [Geomonas sp.]